MAYVASVYLMNITVFTLEFLCTEQKQWTKAMDNDRQLYSMWQMYSVNLAMYVLGHLNNLIVELLYTGKFW